MMICSPIIMLILTLSISGMTTFAAPSARQATSHAAYKYACAKARPGHARCLELIAQQGIKPHVIKPNTIKPLASSPNGNAPYGPDNFHSAYNLPTTSASTQTVAIVDAYDDPNAESDLANYRSTYGLPACTTANGCFSKVNQSGQQGNYPSADSGWAGEISLDLDMVSAICQNCNILLVEANSSSFDDLGASVNEAVALGANEVSNSYGGTESSGDSSICSEYYDHPGVVITASAGDGGPEVEVPAACPNVVAVGGTTLNSDGSETAWNTSSTEGSGGGCSTTISIPSWQDSGVTGCNNRAVADVSADADPNTGAYVYDTYQANGGEQVGGTSESSPIIAAVYALAGGSSNAGASDIWSNYTNGCLNQVDGQTYEYQAGLGSPNGIGCF